MKELTIGTEKVRVIQNIDETNYKRYQLFNQWAVMVFEQQNYSMLSLVKDRCLAYHNKGEHWQVINEIVNSGFMKQLEDPDIDALGWCFGLIVLEEEECESDPQTWNDDNIKSFNSLIFDKNLPMRSLPIAVAPQKRLITMVAHSSLTATSF